MRGQRPRRGMIEDTEAEETLWAGRDEESDGDRGSDEGREGCTCSRDQSAKESDTYE